MKLLAVDLDFTLLDGNRDVTADGKDALHRAEDAGITVALASGRIASSMRHYADALELRPPLVSCNGALVLAADGATLDRHVLGMDVVSPILEFCQDRNVHTNFYADELVYFAEENDWSGVYLSRVRNAEHRVVGWEGLAGLSPFKIIAVAAPETISRLEEEAAVLIGGGFLVTRSEAEYLEFLPAGCSKATGFARLADSLGVAREETAAIGDYFNDVEMLEWAGHSAAVANAPQAVQEAAKVVVGAHDQGGVAQYVDLLLENLEQCGGGRVVLR